MKKSFSVGSDWWTASILGKIQVLPSLVCCRGQHLVCGFWYLVPHAPADPSFLPPNINRGTEHKISEEKAKKIIRLPGRHAPSHTKARRAHPSTRPHRRSNLPIPKLRLPAAVLKKTIHDVCRSIGSSPIGQAHRDIAR